MQSRRAFLSSLAAAPAIAQARRRPNVVFVITDDQGYGDLSVHGNDKLRTPNMDRVAREGVQFTQFHSCPVCSPTRSSIMTGRYNYRTGVVDTYLGRSMMHADEITIPEVLGKAGYRTGIFGKWHLGDNYPLRSIDQGFQESLVHNGGGIGQPSDPPDNHYQDPVLQHNGKPESYRGYCTDIFTDAAMAFVEKHRRAPFFAYLATNAPHSPLEIDESWVAPFRKQGLNEVTAKVYGMVANADRNIGRLLAKLRDLELERDTIVIFTTDNGPQQPRYNAGMRGRKGAVYQGGIRVPFFLRWPGTVSAGRAVDRIAAHVDVMPTLLEACGAAPPAGARLDGRSLMPLARGGAGEWPDRSLYFQWHRGDQPELFRACAVRTQRWKLVDGKELYDLDADYGETRDVAAAHAGVAARLRRGYEEWFRDVSATRGYAPPRPKIGTRFEDPVTLTRQDWRGPRAGWSADSLGHWEVEVAQSGGYSATLRTFPAESAGVAHLRWRGGSWRREIERGATECRFLPVPLEAGPGRLEAFLEFGGKTVGVRYVDISRAG
jgi:arylsulfatase A-like enzyme